MFYGFIKRHWEEGRVTVNLRTYPYNGEIWVMSTGIVALACHFLTKDEKIKMKNLEEQRHKKRFKVSVQS